MLIVGVDEAGTGAWVGGFHVGCVACEIVPFNRAVGRHLRDSKAMSEGAREKAAPLIKEHAIAWAVVEAPLSAIIKSHRGAWRTAICEAVQQVIGKLPPDTAYRLIVDGGMDITLTKRLRKMGARPIYQHRADARYPAVMAAAILAKVTRDSMMYQLDQLYPEFGFCRNKGYGTAEHWEACQRVGITEHHRHIEKFHNCPPYDPESQWYHE